jgi:Asp-tRNA(Asn)/Glu-tRNA(Gln) amidotransferase A subunit family amidase
MNPFATAAETLASIRPNTISARELVELTFQRIDRISPSLNAIVGALGLQR